MKHPKVKIIAAWDYPTIRAFKKSVDGYFERGWNEVHSHQC
ncbi:hypothetical protein LCGC14_1306820, partial [marine sediment metagenome]